MSLRVNHWLMVISSIILTLTGFYIADPYTVSSGETIDKFLMGDMRFVHLLAGFVLTGLILSGAEYDAGVTSWVYGALKPVENLLGGLAVTRFIHHIVTWRIILFMVVHIYMAFWYDVVFKEGTVSSMIGGRVFRKAQH